MLRHIKHRHHALYREILPRVAQYHIGKDKHNVSLDEVTKAFVSLVTIDGRPYSCLEDNGIKMLLDMIYCGCDKSGLKSRINKENIADEVQHIENRMQQRIRTEILHKLLSIQMDIASTQERYSEFALKVYIQFYDAMILILAK